MYRSISPSLSLCQIFLYVLRVRLHARTHTHTHTHTHLLAATYACIHLAIPAGLGAGFSGGLGWAQASTLSSLPAQPVWNSSFVGPGFGLDLAGSQLPGSQWESSVPNVSQAWSADPQENLGADVFQAGVGGGADRPSAGSKGRGGKSERPVSSSEKGRPGRSSGKSAAKGTPRGNVAQPSKKEKSEGANTAAAGKADEGAGAGDQAAGAALQRAGRGGSKTARGGQAVHCYTDFCQCLVLFFDNVCICTLCARCVRLSVRLCVKVSVCMHALCVCVCVCVSVCLSVYIDIYMYYI